MTNAQAKARELAEQTVSYERLDHDKLKDAIRLFDGESLLVRRPFRWLLDGAVISNCYEMFPVETALERTSMEIVDSYGDHIFIVRRK